MLQEYDFKVMHRSGLVNMNANGLSRNPYPSQKDLQELGGMLRRMRKKYQGGMHQCA